MGYFFLSISILLNSAAGILLKLGTLGLPSLNDLTLSSLVSNYLIWIGLLLFAINAIFYFAALARLKLSIAYPLMVSTGFLLVASFSFIYLRESISLLQASGMLLVPLGIVLVTWKEEKL